MKIEIRSDKIPQMSARLHGLVDAVVRKVAHDIEAAAKAAAPVDTGALRNSIHTVTKQESGYEQAAAEARQANPKGEVFEKVSPGNDLEAVVAVAAGYAAYVEFGTSRAGAQPFFTPAAEAARAPFVAACAQAVEAAAK